MGEDRFDKKERQDEKDFPEGNPNYKYKSPNGNNDTTAATYGFEARVYEIAAKMTELYDENYSESFFDIRDEVGEEINANKMQLVVQRILKSALDGNDNLALGKLGIRDSDAKFLQYLSSIDSVRNPQTLNQALRYTNPDFHGFLQKVLMELYCGLVISRRKGETASRVRDLLEKAKENRDKSDELLTTRDEAKRNEIIFGNNPKGEMNQGLGE